MSKAIRIVLTGGSGMLGGAILRQLAEREDVDVIAIQRSPARERPAGNITFKILDPFDSVSFESIVCEFRPTAFIHAAATGMQSPLPAAAELERINVELPKQLMGHVAKRDDCHFIHISSGLAYAPQQRPLREEDPIETTHPYGKTKAASEEALRSIAEAKGIPLTVIRPFSFTGIGDSGSRLFPSLLRATLRGEPFEMSSGEQVRDHCAVDDVARGVLAAAIAVRPESAAQTFNLGSGDTRPLRDVVNAVRTALELEVDIRFGARANSPHEQVFAVADISHAREVLHWRPKQSLAHAVWQLARDAFPALPVKEPAASGPGI